MWIGQFKVVDAVIVKIAVVFEPRDRHDFDQKRIHRLLLVGQRLQVKLIAALAHRRGVGVMRAMQDVVFHESIQRLDIHGNFYFMLAATGENSRHRTHIAKIAAVSDGDMFLGRLAIVGRIKINPAHARRKN